MSDKPVCREDKKAKIRIGGTGALTRSRGRSPIPRRSFLEVFHPGGGAAGSAGMSGLPRSPLPNRCRFPPLFLRWVSPGVAAEAVAAAGRAGAGPAGCHDAGSGPCRAGAAVPAPGSPADRLLPGMPGGSGEPGLAGRRSPVGLCSRPPYVSAGLFGAGYRNMLA
jgi:hypothetical protein